MAEIDEEILKCNRTEAYQGTLRKIFSGRVVRGEKKLEEFKEY